MSLAAATWMEIAAERDRIVAVPIGSCEQHGPHLPLATDTIVASALAGALGARRQRVIVAPAITIGASGEHAGFPGTLSIGTDVLALVLLELVRSADWAAGVVLVNGHGGNAEALQRAVTVAAAESRRALAWWPSPPADLRADAHAGWTETSVLAHLAPECVRAGRAVAGDTRPLGITLPEMRRQGVHQVSPNGVLGDPTGADATAGAEIFAGWVTELVAGFDNWVA